MADRDVIRCYYCSAQAIALCDFVVKRLPARIETCDRPVCAVHRVRVGHMCDRSRRTTNNKSDSIDHCRGHANV